MTVIAYCFGSLISTFIYHICRFVRPSVDLVAVDWNPFTQPNYLLPLLNDLEGWRSKLKDIAKQAEHDGDWFLENPASTFVADFPGG